MLRGQSNSHTWTVLTLDFVVSLCTVCSVIAIHIFSTIPVNCVLFYLWASGWTSAACRAVEALEALAKLDEKLVCTATTLTRYLFYTEASPRRSQPFVAVMRLSALVLAFLLHSSVFASRPAKRHYNTHEYYVLEHDPSADASLDECARTLGVEIVEQAGELRNHWLVRTAKPQLSSREVDDRVLRTFDDLRARASSSLPSRSDDDTLSRRISSAVKYLSRQTLRQRVKRAPPPITPGTETGAPTSQAVAEQQGIVDPEFPRQWHLVNDDFPQFMMNVSSLWERGITGQGVITTLVDDGLDYNSDDLAANFVSL